MLTDEDTIMRARAIAAFARLGDRARADHIHPLLYDRYSRVRANAATALGRIAGDDAREWLDRRPLPVSAQ